MRRNQPPKDDAIHSIESSTTNAMVDLGETVMMIWRPCCLLLLAHDVEGGTFAKISSPPIMNEKGEITNQTPACMSEGSKGSTSASKQQQHSAQ